MVVKATNDRLEIHTLGQFTASRGDRVLSDVSCRSAKLWELFKYLLTKRGSSIPAEVILETIWPEQEYSDARRALRTLVHRLRKLVDGAPDRGESYIKFSHSCYGWNCGQDSWIDADEFESLCLQAEAAMADDSNAATGIYQKAVSLYKGDYLRELVYSEWVLPVRSYYRRLYLEAVFRLTELLKNAGKHTEIIKVCEKAFQVEPFEEDLHLSFLRALLETGNQKQALCHYEYITGIFYREMGVKPSAALKNIYRRIKTAGPETDLAALQDDGEENDARGAFFCGPEVFRSLYSLEKRRMARTGQAVYVGLLSLSAAGSGGQPPEKLPEASERLLAVLKNGLRRGDAVARWNKAQFSVLLPGLDQEQAEKIMSRLLGGFAFAGVELHGTLNPTLPPSAGMSE
jgi:two-component SAPR family response regulator